MDQMSYTAGAVALAPGDALFFYTDGVTEAEGLATAQFGSERLQQTLLATRGQPARAVAESVIEQVATFVNGAAQSDDITCIAVIRKER